MCGDEVFKSYILTYGFDPMMMSSVQNALGCSVFPPTLSFEFSFGVRHLTGRRVTPLAG